MRTTGCTGRTAGRTAGLATGLATSLAALAMGSFLALPATAAQAATHFIDHVERYWNPGGPGWTMMVYPTAWLRYKGGSYAVGESAWDELYARYPDLITRNANGLRDQFICHVQYGAMKDSYNIDDWLPDVGYPQTVEAQCNPTGSSLGAPGQP